MKRTLWIAAAGILVAGLIVGVLTGRAVWKRSATSAGTQAARPETPAAPAPKAAATIWTCSMHPQVHSPKPGKCPYCGMDLIPQVTEESDGHRGLREITFSPNAIALMNVETVEVVRQFVEAQVRMVGKVDYDETRFRYITAWVPGRLDRLFVDYTGVPVNKGDHMVYLYSPDLLAAQEELIQAKKSVADRKSVV